MLLLVQPRRDPDARRGAARRGLRDAAAGAARAAPRGRRAGGARMRARGTRRSTPRSTRRACATRSHARMAGFPHLRVDRFARRAARARRGKRRARCAPLPSGCRARPRGAAARDPATCRRCRAKRRARRRCAARATAARLLRDADLASRESRAALLAAAQGARRSISACRLELNGVAANARLTAFQREHATAVPNACATRRPRRSAAARRGRRPARRARPSIRSATSRFPSARSSGSRRRMRRASRSRLAPTTTASAGCAGGAARALPQVDAAEPTVYVQSAYTRYGDQRAAPAGLHVWFPERPRAIRSILGGRSTAWSGA